MSEASIRLSGVGKMFKIFPSRVDRMIETMGLRRVVPFHKPRFREFWALRGIDLELPKGHRVGIIGRNGAGKSTLLRLITGHLEATEGAVEVHGRVHALVEAGGGFHPEFSGRDNVRVALTYQGVPPGDIEGALQEIAGFTELGEFLDQPYGTYSSGMQARLAFAAATSVAAPGILVIDEILGAGDAYFLNKCSERMQGLVDTGATILLVSHSLEQVMRLCQEAVWLDRGRIAERGPTLEVVKSYQQYVRILEERRLMAANAVGAARSLATAVPGRWLRLRLSVRGAASSGCEVRHAALLRGGEPEEMLRVGDAQDGASSHGSFVDLSGGEWSDPLRTDGELARGLRVSDANGSGGVTGDLAFAVSRPDPDAEYGIEVIYRSDHAARVTADVRLEDEPLGQWELAVAPQWTRRRLPVGTLGGKPGLAHARGSAGERRWPGEGSVAIESVRFLSADGQDRALFNAGEPVLLDVTFRAERDGAIDLIPTAVVYRRDGLLVARCVGARSNLSVTPGERRHARVDLGPIGLGNGYYVVSVALYGELDLDNRTPPLTYDLVDRSYEFAVTGHPALLDGVVRVESRWTID